MDAKEATAQYKKYVADNPGDKENARRSFYDTFGQDPEEASFSKPKRGPLTPQERELRQRAASGIVAEGQAQQKQDTADARAKLTSNLATAIPVAATLATTGGMAAPLAIGTMGMAGAQAGAISEGSKFAFGSRDIAPSLKQFAKNVGIESVLSAGTEIGGRAVGKILEYGGKKVLMPLITKAAAKTDAGMSTLRIHGTNLMNRLRQLESEAGGAAKTTATDEARWTGQRPGTMIDRELETLKGNLALRKTGLTEEVRNVMGDLAGKIERWDGSLAGLTEIKGDMSQAAFKRGGMHFDEQKALQEFVASLDRKLADGFKKIGGGEVYAAQKETIAQLHRYSLGLDLAKESIKRMAFRATYGGVAGGAYGYQHGGLEGAVLGGMAGGAIAAGGKALEEKAAPWLLERLLLEKTTAPVVRQAFAQAAAGKTRAAASTFARAVAQSGVRSTLKKAMEEPEPEPALQ